MPQTDDDWFTCPVCGEVVKANAPACPHCGSDDETGWSEDAAYDEVDLPDEIFGEQTNPRSYQSPTLTYTAIGLIFVILVVWVLAG